MKKQNALMIQMSIFFLFVFVTLGVIVVNEKLSPLKIPKMQEKMEEYLKETHADENLTLEEVTYNEMKYQAKVSNKDNNNYYFIISYKDKELTDTYKNDYEKGKTILAYQEQVIKENIKKKTKSNYKISIPKTLDKYTESIKEQIINSKTPEQIKIYNVDTTITVSKFDAKTITNTIIGLNNNFLNKNITPKSYSFLIEDPDDKTIAVKVRNITPEIINNTNFIKIISDIINKEKSNLLSANDITFEYLN